MFHEHFTFIKNKNLNKWLEQLEPHYLIRVVLMEMLSIPNN